MPDMATEAKRATSTMEDSLRLTEEQVTRAHHIVDRIQPREDKAVQEGGAVGLLAAHTRINDDLNALCERLEFIADKVGLL